MSLQNRVTPDGRLIATPARGTVYGNRGGCFHHDNQTLKNRHWASRQWICCVLMFKDRRRRLMQPGRFTELFFLDEAVALAAGHRPCFECRRADATRFQSLWATANAATPPKASDMDHVLHGQRLTAQATKQTHRIALAAVPDGAFIQHNAAAWLVSGGQLYRYGVIGYDQRLARDRLSQHDHVEMLTPPATAAVLAAGYQPLTHPSRHTLQPATGCALTGGTSAA